MIFSVGFACVFGAFCSAWKSRVFTGCYCSSNSDFFLGFCWVLSVGLRLCTFVVLFFALICCSVEFCWLLLSLIFLFLVRIDQYFGGFVASSWFCLSVLDFLLGCDVLSVLSSIEVLIFVFGCLGWVE